MALLSVCSDIGVRTNRRQKARVPRRMQRGGSAGASLSISLSSWLGGCRAWPWQRYLRDLIAGLAHVPLTHTVAARALGEVHMDVILMIAVGTWSQHGAETGAGIFP